LEPGLEAENPLDAWGTDRDFVARYAECLTAMLDDPAIALAAFFADVRDDYWYSAGVVDSVLATARRSAKPVFIASNSHMTLDARLARRVAEEDVPVIKGTRPALLAVRHVLAWRDARARAGEAIPEIDPVVLATWRDRLSTGETLSEVEGLRLLADCGVPALQPYPVASAEEAVAAAWEIGFPVALKTAEGHAHKSDIGGVRLGLADDAALRTAYAEMAQRLGPRAIVAPMAAPGVEIGVGALVDPSFGPLVMVSAGGTLIELLVDKAVALAPFGPAEARDLVAELRVARLLHGVRGAQPADIDALCLILARFSAVVAALADRLSEIDVNPVIAGPRGAVAVDALVVPRTLPS
jgi:acyl-CoA synthetase (NDP forming)